MKLAKLEELEKIKEIDLILGNNEKGEIVEHVEDYIKNQENLKEIVVGGVCADLCVMDFARTFSRYLDEINKRAKIFVVENTIDTYDSLEHNREEWMDIAKKVMTQAGIIMVPNIEELERKEKELGLILK